MRRTERQGEGKNLSGKFSFTPRNQKKGCEMMCLSKSDIKTPCSGPKRATAACRTDDEPLVSTALKRVCVQRDGLWATLALKRSTVVRIPETEASHSAVIPSYW